MTVKHRIELTTYLKSTVRVDIDSDNHITCDSHIMTRDRFKRAVASCDVMRLASINGSHYQAIFKDRWGSNLIIRRNRIEREVIKQKGVYNA